MKNKKSCFVCNEIIEIEEITYNKVINLPVCKKCMNTEKEKSAEKSAMDSLGEGFVCGCI